MRERGCEAELVAFLGSLRMSMSMLMLMVISDVLLLLAEPYTMVCRA